MESIPYEVINGQLYINSGGNHLLVGNGSPESMCTCGEITLDGRVFQVKQQTLRITPAQLSTALNTPLDGMIGADILTRFDYRVNPFRKELSFSLDEVHPYGYAYHFRMYRSVPIVSVWVANQEILVFFNTGSRITYLEPQIATQFPQVGKAREFYPGIGWINTPLYRVLVWVSGDEVELDVGVPPEALLVTMRMTHTVGILGSDVFRGPGVFLASRRREVIWFWHDY